MPVLACSSVNMDKSKMLKSPFDFDHRYSVVMDRRGRINCDRHRGQITIVCSKDNRVDGQDDGEIRALMYRSLKTFPAH